MRILQVSPHDGPGGAEAVAKMLAERGRAAGHESWLAVGRKFSDDPWTIEMDNDRYRNPVTRLFVPDGAGARALARVGCAKIAHNAYFLAEPRRAVNILRGREDFSYPATRRLLNRASGYDVVHCHNLHGGYFDLRLLPALSRAAPVMLTLHDAWLLGGHCAHSFECDRWMTGCGDCPHVGTYQRMRRDASRENLAAKAEIYAESRFHVSAPSTWMLDKAKRSVLSKGAIDFTYIPNCVDTSVFHPRERADARKLLGLPDRPTVMFMAGAVRNNEWKDPDTLRKAISSVARHRNGDGKVNFIAVGEDSPPERVGDACVTFAPFQRDPARLALYYQASDVYLHSARAETACIVIIEAMACGTPVVATAVGGIPEQICGVGRLTTPGDPDDMAAGISEVLSDPARAAEMGRGGRERAMSRYTIEKCTDAYLKWYAGARI